MKRMAGDRLQIGRGRSAPPARRALLSVMLGACLAAGACALTASAETTWENLELANHEFEKVCIRIGDNDNDYYLIDPANPLTLSLRGPGKLRLLTRHLPRDGVTRSRCYTLLIDRDGERVREAPLLASQSRSANLCGNGGAAVGASEETVVSFPSGRHRFRITIEEPNKQVAVRLFRQKKLAETEYVNFAPRQSERVCTLVRPSGNEYAHYHFSSDQALGFSVNGPTELLVRTRLDFAAADAPETPYELAIYRREGNEGAFEFVEARSFTATPLPEEEGRYTGCPEIIPGQSRRFDLVVPEGSWSYELRPAGPTPAGLTGRILIPREDIALGQ
jgi:hypothetical protein